MRHSVEIVSVRPVTHNVRRFRFGKPKGFAFTPGQATDVAIDAEGWREKKRPFTFTSLADWPELEFTIKIYDDHDGVTRKLGTLMPGDRLLIEEPWGTIAYKGPGTFLAGGAGVTPFIAILRHLDATGQMKGNRLIFSNKTEADIILRQEFEAMTDLDHIWVLTDAPAPGLPLGRIDEAFLRREVDPKTRFYVCGPKQMVKDLRAGLEKLGADAESVTFER